MVLLYYLPSKLKFRYLLKLTILITVYTFDLFIFYYHLIRLQQIYILVFILLQSFPITAVHIKLFYFS